MSALRAVTLAVLVGAASLAGVRSARADANSPAELVQQLGGEDATKRYDAYRALIAKRTPEALPLLAKAVPGMSISGQSFGLSIVQGYGAGDSKPVLERWMTCDAPFLVVASAAVLLRQGEAKAAPAIVKALAAPALDSSTLAMMIGQLYSVRDAKVLAALRGFLKADVSPEILGAALTQLNTASDDGATKAVTALLEAPSASVRALAAAFLLRRGDEAMAEPLATVLASAELPYIDFLRIHALLTRAPRCPEKVLAGLLALVEAEPKGYALSLVIGLLGEYAYAKAVPILTKLLDREDVTVSKASFEALSKIPGALTPDVTKTLLEAKDETRRISAAEALRRLDDLSGLPAVIDVLKRGTVAKADAARALGLFRSRAAVEPLIDALSDADLTVRANAYNSLSSLLVLLFPYRRLDLSSVGYTTTAAADARDAAVRRVRAWWDAHKNAGW